MFSKKKQHDRLLAPIFPIHKKKKREMHLLFKDLLIVILVSSRWNNRSLKVTIHISLVVCWLSWRGFEKSNVKHMGYNAFYKQYIYTYHINKKSFLPRQSLFFYIYDSEKKKSSSISLNKSSFNRFLVSILLFTVRVINNSFGPVV